MGKNACQAYLKAIRSRYRNAGKKAKVTILDEFCAAGEYDIWDIWGQCKIKKPSSLYSCFYTDPKYYLKLNGTAVALTPLHIT